MCDASFCPLCFMYSDPFGPMFWKQLQNTRAALPGENLTGRLVRWFPAPSTEAGLGTATNTHCSIHSRFSPLQVTLMVVSVGYVVARPRLSCPCWACPFQERFAVLVQVPSKLGKGEPRGTWVSLGPPHSSPCLPHVTETPPLLMIRVNIPWQNSTKNGDSFCLSVLSYKEPEVPWWQVQLIPQMEFCWICWQKCTSLWGPGPLSMQSPELWEHETHQLWVMLSGITPFGPMRMLGTQSK